jgi:hypothetical protein
VLIPRKLNIHKIKERAEVPTPKAAKGITPSLEIKPVSTKAVSGSAVNEIKTGIERLMRVLWGFLRNGCGWELIENWGQITWNNRMLVLANNTLFFGNMISDLRSSTSNIAVLTILCDT